MLRTLSFLSFLVGFWIPIIFSNLNLICSSHMYLLDLRNLQEQVRSILFQKMSWSFTIWVNCSSDQKHVGFFLTEGQNNFGNKIPLLELCVRKRNPNSNWVFCQSHLLQSHFVLWLLSSPLLFHLWFCLATQFCFAKSTFHSSPFAPRRAVGRSENPGAHFPGRLFNPSDFNRKKYPS